MSLVEFTFRHIKRGTPVTNEALENVIKTLTFKQINEGHEKCNIPPFELFLESGPKFAMTGFMMLQYPKVRVNFLNREHSRGAKIRAMYTSQLALIPFLCESEHMKTKESEGNQGITRYINILRKVRPEISLQASEVLYDCPKRITLDDFYNGIQPLFETYEIKNK